MEGVNMSLPQVIFVNKLRAISGILELNLEIK